MSLITPTKSAEDPCRCNWHDDKLGLGQPCESFGKHPRASWCLVCGHASSCHQPRTDLPRQSEDVVTSKTVDYGCPSEPLGLPAHWAECHADTDSARVQELQTEASGLRARSADLLAALTALIARVEKTGGYSSPEEQDVLWQAKRVRDGGGR